MVIKVNVAGRLIHCLGLNLFSKFIVEHLARDTGSADSDYMVRSGLSLILPKII